MRDVELGEDRRGAGLLWGEAVAAVPKPSKKPRWPGAVASRRHFGIL